MVESSHHIVNKVFLEVSTPSAQHAFYLRDHLHTFLKDELMPLLEAYFDRLSSRYKHQSIQIERLEIAVSSGDQLDLTELKIKVGDLVRQAIEKKLDNPNQPEDSRAILMSGEEKLVEAFFHFFEFGSIPWWNAANPLRLLDGGEASSDMLNSAVFAAELKRRLKGERFRTGLIKQLNDEQLVKLLKSSFRDLAAELQRRLPGKVRYKEGLGGIGNNFRTRNLYWEVVIALVIQDSESVVKMKLEQLIGACLGIGALSKPYQQEHLFIIRELLESRSPESIMLDLDRILQELRAQITSRPYAEIKLPLGNGSHVAIEEAKDNQATNVKEHDLTSQYVENAGLVLVHPFLKRLFQNCKLMDQHNHFTDRETAVHLLHYIATKQEKQYEYLMLFEKFLCDIAFQKPINRDIALSEQIKMHAEEMLDAIKAYWPVMKDSSNDLLRNEFLRRPGKLFPSDDADRLVVERKTQDILLEKATWNTSIIKLPWKSKILYVEW